MTYREILDNILKAKSLEGLKKAVGFYRLVAVDEGESGEIFVSVLEDDLSLKTESPMHQMLLSFLKNTQNNQEVVNALANFSLICEMFRRAKKAETQQITVAEFNEVMATLEKRNGVKTVLAENYKITLIESNMSIWNDEHCIIILEKEMFVLLPRIENNIDKKKYISRLIGLCLFEMCNDLCSFKHMLKVVEDFEHRMENGRKIAMDLFANKMYEQLTKKGIEFDESKFAYNRSNFMSRVKETIEPVKYIILE